MGSFMGHIIPGSFFISFALWWTFSIFKRYFQSVLHPSGKKYESTATFSSSNSRIPTEPLLKCLASVIGIIGEAVTGFDSNWNYDNIMNNLQHMLMFFFYFMNSISDFAVFYKIKHVPPKIDYIFALMAIFNEGFLFANHLHGRSILDVKLHTCLVVSIVACLISIIIEFVIDKSDVRPAIFRCICHLWQGTWFYHIAFVLYPPPGFHAWDLDNHANAMVTVTFFMVHLAFNVLLVFLISIVVYLGERKKKPQKYESVQSNGHSRLSNGITLSSSDIEEEEQELILNSC